MRVEAVRPFRSSLLLLRFDGIRDRTEAGRWTGRYVLVPEGEVEPPVEGSVFQHELLAMRVELPSGEVVGEVVDLIELPHGLALEVRWRDGVVVLPFGEPFLREVDRVGGRIVLDLPAGLLE
jgi:16S rRNA processing protein RimM